jgi:hypothetical protein
MILRLIHNPQEEQELILPLAVHVHQRIEEVVYKSAVEEHATALAYLDSQDIYSNLNVSIADRSASIPENSLQKAFRTNDFHTVQASSWSTQRPYVLFTDKALPDAKGNIVPLFWCHKLPVNTTSVRIEHVTHLFNKEIEHGFLITENKSKLYFNFTNTFNPLTGAYSLYYVTAITSDGIILKGLINPESGVSEATWEDVDEETGILDASSVYYTKEESTSGFTYYFSEAGTLYVRVLDTSLISPMSFPNTLSTDGWFPRFSAGGFSHVGIDGVAHTYSVPEYESISFFPSRPYFYDSSSSVVAVNSTTLYLGRSDLAIDTLLKPLDLVISTKSGIALYAITTDLSKDSTTYNGSIKWSSDEIASWDNSTGIIDLNITIDANWHINASYIYEVRELLYTETNLNPIYNDLVYNHFYVYYCKPDVTDRAIHHLIIRNDGVIVDCSDDAFALLVGGIYNPNTVIGMLYRPSLGSTYQANTWTDLFSTQGLNTNQCLVLAEYFFVERKNGALVNVVDVRIPGNVLNSTNYADAVYRNPKLFQSQYAATWYGAEWPQNNAYCVRLSRTLLEDFGGIFTDETLREALHTWMPAGKDIVFEWDETVDTLAIENIIPEQLTVTWNTIESGFCYDIYRSASKTTGFELLTTVCVDYVSGSHTDSVASEEVWYYYVVPTKDGIEFPASYTIGAEAR